MNIFSPNLYCNQSVSHDYGCENMSVKHFVLILKTNMAAIANYSKIINMF